MCDFKVCISLEFKKKSKHAKRHLFVCLCGFGQKNRMFSYAICKDLVRIYLNVFVSDNITFN